MFLYFVPTTTIIAKHPDNPYLVCALRPRDKHNGKLVLPGGRFEANSTAITEGTAESLLHTGLRELGQEVSLGLENATLFTVKTDPTADVREVTLGKVTFLNCPPELVDLKITAAYGVPDVIIEGVAVGSPAPKDGEAKEVLWINSREQVLAASPDESLWGASHDLIVEVYLRKLLGTWTVDPSDFLDVTELRRILLANPR